MDVMLLNEAGERVERRKTLLERIKEMYPEKDGTILFLGGVEQERDIFYQDSTFEYFVGLQESTAVVCQPFHGSASLFLPQYTVDRSAWLPETFDEERLAALAIEKVEHLGQPVPGYSAGPFFQKEDLENFLQFLEAECAAGKSLFTATTAIAPECRWILKQICQYLPVLEKSLVAIDPIIAQMRRTKSQHELEHLYHAAEITAMAQQAAAGVIKRGNTEADVQAAIEYIFIESGARKAFPSIVGSGVNSTILHYVDNSAALHEKDLVVVDIGASFNHYCSDVTRTYPVSGTFSSRQKEVYRDVLACQSFIAEKACPGMFLNNRQEPDKCLNTLAHNFLKERGYEVEKVFPHGIGHFVGLDVHDVGDPAQPLAPGDVITIEPGIYLRDEGLGVRIEDVYWIVKDGAVCLTEEVPKEPEAIEKFMCNSRFVEDLEQHKTEPHEH